MPHPIDAHVGTRIREERLRAGLTQEVLASGIGVKFQQLQKYETGKNRVSCSRLWEISRVLEVPMVELLPEQDVGSFRS
jgi:transcriptional regulator with XRE-family HTH domain